MRLGLLFIFVVWSGAAWAEPITLLCDGSLNADGKQVAISGETAIVDLEKLTFKPPLYSDFKIKRVSESDLSFGSELQTLSTWGSLDRVSGTLTMNVLTPDERKKLQAGGSAHFLAWMSAKCALAKRMF